MRFFFIGLVIGVLSLFLFIGFVFETKSGQPISFNHKKHSEQGMECASCHRYFKTQNFSGMPGITICMDCHKDAVSQNPEEEKIRQFHQKGKEIPWKRLYEQPDHVFFSHRRHVVLAKMDCQSCHGNIGQSEMPPSKPWIKMTMKWCMDCHAKTKASNDCLACHV